MSLQLRKTLTYVEALEVTDILNGIEKNAEQSRRFY